MAQDLLQFGKGLMKPFVFFFVALTLAEIFFSTCYYFLVGRITTVIIISGLIYLACIVTVFIGWQAIMYSEKRKALIDSLP
ncbi:MAG: hypothetical protein EOO10_14965 [Chitinophagaceae bacterium]|nr:MAG: hypothetical protein EOO10_14965 [Chitinophagaceae bacterium]